MAREINSVVSVAGMCVTEMRLHKLATSSVQRTLLHAAASAQKILPGSGAGQEHRSQCHLHSSESDEPYAGVFDAHRQHLPAG